MMTLIMGQPNAGKTTYSKRFENVIHLDDLPSPRFTNCQKIVTDGNVDIVVEGIYNTVERRKRLLGASQHHDRKVCIWLDTSDEERIRRGVRLPTQNLEPPSLDEGWDEIIRIGDIYEQSSNHKV